MLAMGAQRTSANVMGVSTPRMDASGSGSEMLATKK